MDNQLDFYEVSADYIAYLLKFDSKVPHIDYSEASKHDKFMCGIVLFVNGYDYFAPISSFAVQQRTNMVITNEKGKSISSIRFSFMIPIPQGVATPKSIKCEPSPEYRRLLNLELRFCRKNEKAIRRMAKHIYNSVVNVKDPIMVKNCCNFSKLETACANYNASNEEIEIINAYKKGQDFLK